MESRAHSSLKRSTPCALSRILENLKHCSKDFESSFSPRIPGRRGVLLDDGSRHKNPHVCVVGAGLAGLRCAEVLLKAHVEVTVFEARDRLGGRVCQQKLAGHWVDMGPNWVHGSHDNPMAQLAREAQTEFQALGEDSKVYGLKGEPCDDKRIAVYYDIIWSIINKAFDFSNEHCARIGPDKSFRDFFREKLEDFDLLMEQKEQIFQMAETWGSFIGDDWDVQSLKWFWLEECLDGDNLFVLGSHKDIIQRLSNAVVETADVHTDTRVTRIQNVTGLHSDPAIRVTIQHDGQDRVFDFDEVVLTVPLGCLKQDAIAFDPPIPSRIRDAVANASISSYEKVYLAFPSAFWDTLRNTEGKEQPMSAFVAFLGRTQDSVTDRRLSLELIVLSDTERFGCHAMPALLFSFWGQAAKELTCLTDGVDTTSQLYLALVTDLLRPYFSQLPNYSEDDVNCTPVQACGTNWQNDALAGNGSYTNFKCGGFGRGNLPLDEGFEALWAGLPERGVWFAGEHAGPFVALGTSTGAYWSGESVAMRLLATNGCV